MKTETALDPNSYFRLTLIVPAIALIFWETDLEVPGITPASVT